MNPREGMRAAGAWILSPRGVMAFAVSLLFVLMAVSFVNIPWNRPPPECGDALCEIPVFPSNQDGGVRGISIGEALFGPYAILVLVSALVLAACMIGGVYLAKTEARP